MSSGTKTVIQWMAPGREEGKEGGGGVLVVGCRRLAMWKAGKAEDMLGSTKRRNRRLAMLEDTRSPETCLSSWRTQRLPLGSRRGLPSSNGSVVLEERVDIVTLSSKEQFGP
jgi:hypothetical protein